MDIDLVKTQQYLEWLKEKLYLNHIAPSMQNRRVYRGEVYRCKFGIGIGSEECKERPCVILQCNPANSASPNTLVAPITHTQAKLAVVVPISPKIDKSGKTILDGNVLLGNITCISKARLGSLITKLTKEELAEVDIAIARSLGIHEKFHKLECMYQDQLEHTNKLKEANLNLQQNLDTLLQQQNEFQLLLEKYQIADIIQLNNILSTYSNKQ